MRISLLATSEVHAIGKVAYECGFQLDLPGEVRRSFARIWVARLRDACHDPQAFLLAWQAANELDVIAIGTSTSARRCGLARGLVAEMLRYAVDHGLERVLLEVRVSNVAALKLYQSYGFELGRIRTQYYSNPTEDGAEMALELKCASLDASTLLPFRYLEA